MSLPYNPANYVPSTGGVSLSYLQSNYPTATQVTAQAAAVVARVLIATVTTTGSTNSIAFSSIPQTYNHLEIEFVGTSAASSNILVNFSPETASQYNYVGILNTSSSTTAPQQSLATTNIVGPLVPISTNNLPGSIQITIPYYSVSPLPKSLRGVGGCSGNSATQIMWMIGGNTSTAAITGVTLSTASTFTNGSVAKLYGIT